MRTHRRRTPLQHVLVAGSIDELPGITSVLTSLPADAYGQVLVEADPAVALPELDRPARVTVHRVDRLSEAVSTWIAEWMPEQWDPAREVGLWIGACSAAAVRAHDHGPGTVVEHI